MRIFSVSNCDISKFTAVTARLFDAHPKDRIVVFRNAQASEFFGVIRVLEKETGDTGSTSEEKHEHDDTEKKSRCIWENVRGRGTFIGLIPAGCRFEAMYVEVKSIILK